MAYIAPSSRSTDDLITAAIWNADVVANEIAIYAGALSVSSQAIGDLLAASSTTQYARVAAVAAGQVLASAGTGTVPAWSSAPALSGLTASKAVFTNGSQVLASNDITGSGNVVMSAGPTLTGTIGGAEMTLSGLTASLPIFSNGSKQLVSNAMTGTGSVVMSAGPTLTGTIGGAEMTLSGLTASRPIYTDGSKALTNTGPSGSILQTVYNNPDSAAISIGSASWVTITSANHLAITPISASSNLILTFTCIFGGNNTTNLTHFKFYDVTAGADVNFPGTLSNRSGVHGSTRQVEGDANDVDVITISTTVASDDTDARTYGIYTRNESGSGAKYFNATTTDSAAIGHSRAMFTITEVI